MPGTKIKRSETREISSIYFVTMPYWRRGSAGFSRGQIRSVAAVDLENVVGEPVAEEVHQTDAEGDVAALGAAHEVFYLLDQVCVQEAVLGQAGIGFRHQESFFGGKVVAGVVGQFAQQGSGDTLRLALHHSGV
jgi:hypothetical protein